MNGVRMYARKARQAVTDDDVRKVAHAMAGTARSMLGTPDLLEQRAGRYPSRRVAQEVRSDALYELVHRCEAIEREAWGPADLSLTQCRVQLLEAACQLDDMALEVGPTSAAQKMGYLAVAAFAWTAVVSVVLVVRGEALGGSTLYACSAIVACLAGAGAWLARHHEGEMVREIDEARLEIRRLTSTAS